MTALYKISNEYLLALESLQELMEGSELDEAMQQQIVQDSLAHIKGAFESKALNVAAYIANLKLEMTAVKTVQERMVTRAKALERQVIHLQNYLLVQMQRLEVKKLSNEQLQVSIRDNPQKVVIDDVDRVPSDFKEIVSEIKISKSAISEQLKQGFAIAGCHLERSQRLEIK